MLTIVLVDDELSCLEDLSLALKGKANILGKFTNPLEAVEKIRELQPSAAFLDIEMPGIDGFATAYEMLAIYPDIGIVFVTAHGECALKAFEIDADDFVVKPFCPERLAITVQRLEKKLQFRNSSETENLRGAIHRQIVRNKPVRIGLWQDDHLVLIKISDIACCFMQKAQRRITVIANETAYHCNDNFNDFLEKINNGQLLRCHRSFAVNPRHLLELTPGRNNTLNLKVSGFHGDIPVSRKYSTELRRTVGLRTSNG